MAKARPAKVDIESISLADLYEFPDNPNEESAAVYNNLMMEIQEDGFDQPLVVVPRDNIEPGCPGYSVVSGNHRLRALKQQRFTHADCVVKDWDAETAKIKLIRRNMIFGELNDDKFTRIVDSLRLGYTPDQLADALGFITVEEFAAHYQNQQTEEEQNAHHNEGGGSGDPTKFVDGLTASINKLIMEYGDTVPYSFMFFIHGGKVHVAIQTNTQLRRVISKVAKRCLKETSDINHILTGLLVAGMATPNLDRVALEELSSQDEDLDEDLKPVVGRGSEEVSGA